MAHILAVEDHPDHLALITSWIKALGHTAATASSADESLHRVEERQPDLVLCDLRLDGSSGYDVARSIREQSATCALPLIAVTAYDAREKAMAGGFDGYLRKPLTLERLQKEMERVLPSLGQAAAPAALEQAPETENNWKKAGLPRTGKRILVLDNTTANRDLMKVVLDYGGHDARCVATLNEALAAARSWRPDLMLCDMDLGKGQRGTELLNAFQKDPDLRDIRFAFTSATRGTSVEHTVRQKGARAFLRLPMEPVVLLREISKLLA